MRRNALGILLMGMFALTFAAPGTARAADANVSRWDFTVYLDDKKFGRHTFEVVDTDGETRVKSEANFKYTILRIPAYRYEHVADERWNDNCLMDLEARTNANGDRVDITGERNKEGFVVDSGEDRVKLPNCVMTFAYWNEDFLAEPSLLNPQTGEYVAVNVEEVGVDTVDVRGEPVQATRYRLTAYDVDLTLWYSPQGEWLALESVAEGDRIIRYELS